MHVAPFRSILLFSLLALACPAVVAQTAPVAGSVTAEAPAIPAARPADVSSINGILDALYDVISGPKEQARDWNRLRSLFAPGARVIPTHTDKNGVTQAQVMSVEEFVAMAGPTLAKEGFFERESHRMMQRYGAIAHVFSTYESRHAATDAKPFQRGINSIQLLFDGHRWWVVTIYWQAERPDLAVPKQYGG